ncbi:MAG: hypothetical protein RR588_12985 [Solibacillus sp.]
MEKYHWDFNLKIRLLGETLFNLLYWMYFPFIAVYFSQTIGLTWAGFMLMVPPIISALVSLALYKKLFRLSTLTIEKSD